MQSYSISNSIAPILAVAQPLAHNVAMLHVNVLDADSDLYDLGESPGYDWRFIKKAHIWGKDFSIAETGLACARILVGVVACIWTSFRDK